MTMAQRLARIAETDVGSSAAVDGLKAERDEVSKYLGKRVAFLEEENFELYKRLKDEYSQHARYNKFKAEVEGYLGEDKKGEFQNMKKRARLEAHEDFTTFLNQQKACLEERKQSTQVLKDEHERKMKKIREDAQKKKDQERRGKSNGGLAFSTLTDKGKRKKDNAEEKKEKVARPKTAPQYYNFEEKTKRAWEKAKAEAKEAGNTDFPTLVAWGNAEYSNLTNQEKEKYETMARKAREALGLPPVVPRATPRAPAKKKGTAIAAAAAAPAPVESKSKDAQEKKKKTKKPESDDDDDDSDSDHVAAAARAPAAAPSDDDEEEEEEEEEEEDKQGDKEEEEEEEEEGEGEDKEKEDAGAASDSSSEE